MKVYTRKGDGGTTGVLFGGRVAKASPVIEAGGAVDEAQAAFGLARAEVERESELDALLVELERDLYVVGAEVSTPVERRDRLDDGRTRVTAAMVEGLEARIDALTPRFPPLRDFVVPGHDRVSAALDLARTAVRRAERAVAALGEDGDPSSAPPSYVGAYLNRLSDLAWTMARWQEHGESLLSRRGPRGGAASGDGTAGEGSGE